MKPSLDEPVTCPRGCTRPSLIPGRAPLPALCDPLYETHPEGDAPAATRRFRCPACHYEHDPRGENS